MPFLFHLQPCEISQISDQTAYKTRPWAILKTKSIVCSVTFCSQWKEVRDEYLGVGNNMCVEYLEVIHCD